jgi:acetyl esterase/lipase
MYTSLQRPLDFYFNEPYASQLSQLEEIDKPVNLSLIDPNPQKLFKKDLIDNILNGTDKVLLDVMAQNDVFDWKPTAPITLFHGTTDDYVYPSNSESAFAHIQSQGGDIRYVPLEGMNHQQAVMPYFLEASKIIFKE